MTKRIAIADDDRELRDLMREALRQKGYEVTVVPNGLRLFSALKIDRPDLVLLDVNMSWIDGIELCRAMKRNPEYKDIPVLFVSGKSTESDVQRGLDSGAVGYLTKPISLSKLLNEVQHILEPTPA